MNRFHFLMMLGFIITLSSCKKENEVLDSEPLSTYFPLQIGKYITYRLDSTVYLPFGTSSIIRSYEVKLMTEEIFTDNLGRKAYSIGRYMRNNPAEAWFYDGTSMAVNDIKRAEFIENNLRFIKLTLPIRNGHSWKGNSFIDTYSLGSTVRYLDGWDYQYDSVGISTSIGDLFFDNTIRIDQRNEILGNPDDPSSFSEINIGIEKYAAGLGLIYKKLFHSEYQPGGNGFFADGSYGVEYTIIDHN